MARVSDQKTIAMGQEADKWFRSSYVSALVSPIEISTSWFLSLFTKPEPPPPPSPALPSWQTPPPPALPPSWQPPPPPPESTFIRTFESSIDLSPNSSANIYQRPQLQPIPSPITCYHSFMDTRPLNSTIPALNEHERPTTIGSSTSAQSDDLPVHIVQNTNTGIHQTRQPQILLNPMVQLLRDQELGKTVLTFVVPMTTGVLSVHTKDSSPPLPLPLTLLSLCIGLSALWNGILLRNRFPIAANAVEQLGTVSIFFAFFSVVSSLLPPTFVWVPWSCFVAILLPSALSLIPSHWRRS